MMQTAEISSTIFHLVGALKDGEQGYKQAAEAANDSRLKSLFNDYARQRARFLAELQSTISQLGQFHLRAMGSVAGALHRAWLSLRITLSSGNDRALLAECERGEESALEEYEKAVQERLSPPIREVLCHQYHEVKSAHDRIHDLRVTVRNW